MSFKKWLIRISKITAWFVFSLILFLILIIVVIRIPAVQHKLIQKAVGFLEQKIGTPVKLQRITISFPKKIVIEGLHIEDQAKDSLLYVDKLGIDTDLWALLHHRIQLDKIQIKRGTFFIHRMKGDTLFNYSYILKAFQGSASEKSDTSASTPWEFAIRGIECSSLNCKYQDTLEGNDISLALGKLDIDVGTFDVDHSIFKVDALTLQDTRLTIIQSKNPEITKDSSRTPDIGFENLSLRNVIVNYSQSALGQVVYLNLGKAQIHANDVDLNARRIDVDKILLDNTFVSYQQMKSDVIDNSPRTDSSVNRSNGLKLPFIPWDLSIRKIELNNNAFQYDNFQMAFNKKGLDVNHVWISNFSTACSNIVLDEKEMSARIENFSLLERNGFSVRSLKAGVRVTNNQVDIHDFYVDSGRSTITLAGQSKFNSLTTLFADYPHAKVTTTIASVIDIDDVLYFKPDLLDSLPVQVNNFKKTKFHASMDGTLNNLTIHDLAIDGLTHTTLQANGTIRNLPDFQHAVMAVDLSKFYTVRADVLTLIDSSAIQSIEVPKWLEVKGKFQGTIHRPSIQSSLLSDIGSITINTTVELDSAKNKGTYTGYLLAEEFDLGKLLRQEETMGKVTMKASVAGAGFTMNDLNAKLDLDIDTLQFHKYDYTHLRLKGDLQKYFFTGEGSMKDQNIDLAIRGSVNYTNDVPRYKLTCDLANADFKALNLSARALRARGTLDVDLATKDLKVLNGTVALRKVAIYNGQALYKVDSLLFASIDQDGQTDVKISSDIVSGNFTGTLNLSSLPDALERYVNNYFTLKDSRADDPVKAENFKFDLVLKKTALLTDIIFPELRSFEPGPIKGEFNNLENKLNIHIAVGKIHYDNYVLDSILLNVKSTKQAITCELLADNFTYDSIRINTLKLDGRIAHDSIRTSFLILDSLSKEKYKIAGVFRSLQSVFQFHLLKDEVVLNYAVWKAPEGNYLRFGRGGITTHDMSLSYNNEKIVVERATDSTAMLHVGFRTLELATLSGMISGKKAVVEGRLNGDMNFPMIQNKLFHASVKISDLIILKQAWGNVDFSIHDLSAGKVNLALSILGDNTDLRATGVYTATTSDISATIAKLNLKIIEPFIAKNVRNMSGTIVGKMKITGNLKSPSIRGEVTFNDAYLLSAYVNTGFRLKNETVTFNENGILFKNFKILDEGNNSALLNGSMATKNFMAFDLNLNLTAKNFQLLNTTAKDNTLYYGKVKVNSRATITGNLDQPVVEMNLGFSDDTQFTYVIPQSDKGVLDQKGIVVFVDKDEKHDAFLSSIHLADTIEHVFKGFSLSANVELSGTEIFNIIIDPITGDKLSVQGASSLTLEMDPSGNINLAGRYEISKGSYSLSFYKLVKRNFSIDKGSTITWYGDPLNASLDIKAIFEVETSPQELTGVEATGITSSQLVPFYVYLIIKGELMAPAISFQLDMPIDKRNIYAGSVYRAIQDINTRDSDLNKQVFALLVLKRFMADNPFENQASGDLAASARTSVSRILSDQLNRLSQNVKGVKLSVDLKSYEDYTKGQAAGQTQLQLGVSKNLLNDRLVVKLSGNVDVEGENNTQNSFTDYIGDLALEYKLTPDGRLRVTGFRNSDYDMIDGELTKTGAGLIYIKDYNAFKELFKANEKQ